MPETHTLIADTYAAFNHRDIDGALALMSDHVRWPRASEGGEVVGKDEIRAYWTRQWSQFDPHVEPLAFLDRDEGKVEVRVHQLVKSLDGDLLSDSEVRHTFTVSHGLIDRMELETDGAGPATAPSAAFPGH